MKRKILAYLLTWILWVLSFGLIWWNVYATEWWEWGWEWGCKWIKLNTNFPIIWNCIWTTNTDATNVFPQMIWALTKIAMALVLVVCFILVIVAWIMWAADEPTKGKELLKKVAITVLLLWFSWVILRIINPTFFS